MYFNNILLQWFAQHKRQLPWRENRSAYNTWISEIILQQTRVTQGIDYYLRFVNRLPNVHALANASEQEVLKLWEGLGYYSRARNLHSAAKQIVESHNGEVPVNYHDLIQLKGIGPYTAAAIASISSNEKVAVVDGNVFRVLARYFGIYEDVAQPKSRAIFQKKAENEMGNLAGDFNEAMMEFGALQCVPVNPDCSICPLQKGCVAFDKSHVDSLPSKSKKTKPEKVDFHYLVLTSGDKTMVTTNNPHQLWKGLYDLPLLSVESGATQIELTEKAKGIDPTLKSITKTSVIKHQLTHRSITAHFWKSKTQHSTSVSGFNHYNSAARPSDNPPVTRLAQKYFDLAYVE